jgi:hypothetical protein
MEFGLGIKKIALLCPKINEMKVTQQKWLTPTTMGSADSKPSMPLLRSWNFSNAVARGGREVSMPMTSTLPEKRSNFSRLKKNGQRIEEF